MKIQTETPAGRKEISLHSDGFQLRDGTGAEERWVRFAEVHSILMSADHILSLQMAGEMFSIPTDPASSAHRDVIASLVYHVAQAAQRAEPARILN